MRFLDLDIIKKHLNLDQDFNDDNMLLESYADAAEKSIENFIDCDLENTLDTEGELPKPLLCSMLLMIGDLYTVRQSISATSFVKVPRTLEMLIEPYINYKKTLC
jgi:uncharacterized phage protein (predicted DNA packaging)